MKNGQHKWTAVLEFKGYLIRLKAANKIMRKGRLIFMTGKEFLDKVRSMKTITDISWHVEGDVLDPDKVKVVIIADGEKIEVSYPKTDDFIQKVSIGLVINKFMEQIGNDFRTNVGKVAHEAVNYSIKHVRKVENEMMIKEVASILGETEQFIRTGLQKGIFPFGTAEKVDGKFIYSIDKAAFNKFMSMIKTTVDGKRIGMTLDEVIAAIDSKNIAKLELVPDKKNDPMVSVWVDNDGDLQFYNFPAIKGYQIHTINEFLRSLNLDNKIEFKTYVQYGQLLTDCMNLLDEKNKATA